MKVLLIDFPRIPAQRSYLCNIPIVVGLHHYLPSNSVFTTPKNVLGRVRNYIGERTLSCKMVASSYVCHPNHSYVDCPFHLHSDLTRGLVFASVLDCI